MHSQSELEDMVKRACETEDLLLMARALEFAPQGTRNRNFTPDTLNYGLEEALEHKSRATIRYLLDHGADINAITMWPATHSESKDIQQTIQTLQLALDFGWDINSWGHGARPGDTVRSRPYLWSVIKWPELADFCLEHGARVDIIDDRFQEFNVDGRILGGREDWTWPLLDCVAGRGTVEQFELFRARGAPSGFRMLHNAVERAVMLAPDLIPSDQKSPAPNQYYEQHMDMVKHLLKLRLVDVNAVNYKIGDCCSTALGFVAYRFTSIDVRELTWLLLDAGADPYTDPNLEGHSGHSAIALANTRSNFLTVLKEWEEKKAG